MKHTKGPWLVKGNYIETQDEYPVALIELGLGSIQKVQANARLIAAAPELLEALKNMYEMYRVLASKDHTQDDSLMFNARQAIRKAEGKE